MDYSQHSIEEKELAKKMSELMDRLGDEMGNHLKPIMYKVTLNDKNIEKDFMTGTELEKYRFYLVEGMPINNRTNPQFSQIFDEVRFSFLRCLEKIAKDHKLALNFPEDLICVCCDDLAQLSKALEIMSKMNQISELDDRPKQTIDLDSSLNIIEESFKKAALNR